MVINASVRVGDARPEIACAETESCSYLRALSTIEHIAGFEHTARNYAAAASHCREQGCRAVSMPDAGTPSASPTPIPIPVKAASRPPRLTAFAREAQTIPFIRSNLIDITSDHDGNYVERRALKLNSLPTRGDPLSSLYRYWGDLRAAGACQFSSIDTVPLTRAGIIGKLHVVDVSSGDPEEFRYELFGYDVPIGRYEAPRAYPVAIMADSVMRDYNTVRLTAVPRLHRMRCGIGGTTHHYTRLILPFLDKRAQVTRLLVAIREEAGNGVAVEPGD
ncbi:MAG TPA: hypothetical protein VEI03_09470 [Stellaceae bacterium]|nr:hypothetical protein [Stellaceae bacterium]